MYCVSFTELKKIVGFHLEAKSDCKITLKTKYVVISMTIAIPVKVVIVAKG